MDDFMIAEKLKRIGIIDVTKLNPNQQRHIKLLKAYCKDITIMENLLNVIIR